MLRSIPLAATLLVLVFGFNSAQIPKIQLAGKMKSLIIFAAVAIHSTLITADTTSSSSSSSSSSSFNVASVLTSYYGTHVPSTLSASQSTALASAIRSVQSTWWDSPKYTSADEAIYSAAPPSAQSSMSASGFVYELITTETWYTKNVPTAVQSDVVAEISAVKSMVSAVAGSASKGAAAARVTGRAVVGVLGVAGALVVL